MDKKAAFFQLKMIRKKTKPLIWRRAYVPSGITFCQMAVVLEELLELPRTKNFEFEFYNRKERIIDFTHEGQFHFDIYYSFLKARDHYVNEWFQDENSFSFRIRKEDYDGPEYRVEIEGQLEGIELSVDGKMCSLDFPLLVKEVSVKNDKYWSSGKAINDKLHNGFRLYDTKAEYLFFDEVIEALDAGKGLGWCADPVDRDDHTIVSIKEKISQLAEIHEEALEKSKPLIKEAVKKITSSVEWNLKAYEKEDLISIAQETGYTLRSSRKDQMAYELARHILEPDIMRALLIKPEEDEIEAFEAALERKAFLPTETELEKLRSLIELNYVAAYENDKIEVSKDAAAVFSVINKEEYRKFRRKAHWLWQCLNCLRLLHGAAPEDVLYELYCKNPDMKKDRGDFLSVFNKIPSWLNPCRKTGTWVAAEVFIQNGLVDKLKNQMNGLPFYIPSREEIVSYARNSYPAYEKDYAELFLFFQDNMKLEKWDCEDLCITAFSYFSMSWSAKAYLASIEENGLTFSNEDQKQKLLMLCKKLMSSTRMVQFRGHTPAELSLVPNEPGKNTTKEKKIYPNDSCPCGSGKKYKKCCGRNV